MVSYNNFITKMPSIEQLTNNEEYWLKLNQLKKQYSEPLKDYMQNMDTYSSHYNQVQIVEALLRSDPNTHRFPCKLPLLLAVEEKLKAWLCL